VVAAGKHREPKPARGRRANRGATRDASAVDCPSHRPDPDLGAGREIARSASARIEHRRSITVAAATGRVGVVDGMPARRENRTEVM